MKGKKYFYIIDGSTSDSMKRFAGKWRDLDISSISQCRFSFDSSDAHPMFETRTYSRVPLPVVPVGVPENPDFQDSIYVKQFSTNSFTNAPSWVNGNSVEHARAANPRPFGTSVMSPADPASRAGATPEASGDS